MSAEVVPLREAAKPALPEKANPEIVAILSWLLREAETGQLHAVAIAALRLNEEAVSISTTMFAGAGECPADLDRIIGSVATLQHRLVAKTLSTFSTPPTEAPKAPA